MQWIQTEGKTNNAKFCDTTLNSGLIDLLYLFWYILLFVFVDNLNCLMHLWVFWSQPTRDAVAKLKNDLPAWQMFFRVHEEAFCGLITILTRGEKILSVLEEVFCRRHAKINVMCQNSGFY